MEKEYDASRGEFTPNQLYQLDRWAAARRARGWLSVIERPSPISTYREGQFADILNSLARVRGEAIDAELHLHPWD